MKLTKSDRSEGYAEIRVENEDDLWNLERIVSEGDQVRGLTRRTKIDGREKKTLKLTVRAEKVELQNDRLRVTGEIEKAGEEVEHGYHTINVEEGDRIQLWKDFTDAEWQELMEAEDHRSYSVLFCVVESGEADLYLVKESGIEDLSRVSENIPGKMYESEDEDSFRNELKQVLERSAEDVDSLVLAGPGFEKEKVYEELSDEARAKAFTQDTSVTGETGLNEAIKRGALDRVVESSRIDEETELLEEFYSDLKSGGEADYGIERAEELAEMGAIETMMAVPDVFRERQDLVKKVERNGGEVVQVHTDHEPGERLENLGGVAMLLRYSP